MPCSPYWAGFSGSRRAICVSKSCDSHEEIVTKISRAGFVFQNQGVLQLSAALAFLLLVGLFASLRGGDLVGLSGPAVWLLIISAVVGAYMAMNIGANDVANNLGPVVGSGAITMG